MLATGRYIGEGFDGSRLDTLFLTMPVSWRGTLVQYAGRLHRGHPGKTEVRIYDYADPQLGKHVASLRRHGGTDRFGATDVDRAIAVDQSLQIGPAIIHILNYIQLRFPVIEPGFGEPPLGASVAVPETAAHEDRLAAAGEH